jgi:segregation and condensation protein B
MARRKGTPKDNRSTQDLESFGNRSDDYGLSLDELSESFARLLGGGDSPYEAIPSGSEVAASESAELPAVQRPDDDVCPVSPRSIVESILFAGHPEDEPISSRQIASLMRGVRAAEVDALVHELNQMYEEEGCPYHVESVGAGYRMTLRPEFARVQDRFYRRIRSAKLSQAAISVLALVAYQQPISRQDVLALCDDRAGRALAQLVRRGLVAVQRQGDEPRAVVYRTTHRFLEVFQLDSLADLPRNRELPGP